MPAVVDAIRMTWSHVFLRSEFVCPVGGSVNVSVRRSDWVLGFDFGSGVGLSGGGAAELEPSDHLGRGGAHAAKRLFTGTGMGSGALGRDL